MGPIVGIGFGPAATVAYVVTLGFGISMAATPATGPGFIMAASCYVPGAQLGSVYGPGAQRGSLYVPGAQRADIDYGES